MSKRNNKKTYIKLFRGMIDWEWYTDVNTKVLFLHCLLMANWSDKDWHGTVIKRGQFVTSIDILSRETGLSIQEVRTALEHLESTNEITRTSTNKNTTISVVSYDKFQGEQQANQQADQQSNNNQITNEQQQRINIYKNNKENKEIYDSPSPEGSAVIEEEKGDGHGDPPEGWNEKWEVHFQKGLVQNPQAMRDEWYDFWHDEGKDDPDEWDDGTV